MKARRSIDQLSQLVRKLVEFTGWRAVALIALMVAAALSEGLGLLLIIPLLVFTGSTADIGTESLLANKLEGVAAQLGLSFSFEVILALFVLMVIVRQLVVFFEARLAADTRIDYVTAIRKEYFASLGETSWRYLSGGRLDQLGQILLVDSWRIGEAALHFIRILSGLVLLLANVAVAVLLSPVVAAAVLGSIIILTWVFSNRLYRVRKQGSEISEIHNDVYRVVENYLDNIRTAKMASATHRMQSDFASTIDSLSDRLSDFVRDSELIKMSLQVVGAIAIAIALLLAVNILKVSGPELLLLVFISARFIPRVSSLNQDLHRLMHDLPAFEHANDVLVDCRRNPDVATNCRRIAAPVDSIGVRDIVVAYDEDPDKVILDRVSLSVAVGETVAITGPSGIGKSTLVDTIAGLLLPDSGDIVIDGKPLVSEELGGWRDQVGYVSQSAGLLQDTIERNLTWINTETTTRSELENAIRCAEMAGVIQCLPKGLNTVIDRRDGRLSSGERQRLAIARELLRKPTLLILDEATNALDVETESLVLKNVRQSYPELTILMVAHRKTAIAMADRVVHLGGEKSARRN